MLRANVVLQELSMNAEGKCCSARTESECVRDIKRSYCEKYETFLCSAHISFKFLCRAHISLVFLCSAKITVAILTAEKASLLGRCLQTSQWRHLDIVSQLRRLESSQ